MRSIVMLGTHRDTRGGISAVVRVWEEAGLLQRHGVRYIATHRDGGRGAKLAQAVSAWLQYAALLLSGRVALLHVHSASGPSFWRKSLFIVPSFWLRVPVVLHWHGGGFVRFFEGSSPGRQRFIAWLFRRCDRVVALSPEWQRTLLRLVPGIRVTSITNPVRMSAQPAALEGAPPQVLFLGLVNRHKGVYDLLRAWHEVQRRIPEARLRIGGVGELAEARETAQRLGIAESVEWLGWIGEAERAQALQAAWLLVLPSYMEGVPMSLLEAMAAGVPVVSTRVGGIPQAVRDGLDGRLLMPGQPVALAEAIVELLADAPLRQRYGSSARRRAAEVFSADVVLPQVEALWAQLLAPAAQEQLR